jgi:CrcB protein
VSWTGLAAVAAGGFIGSLGRYGLEHAVPGAPTRFPLTTWLINTSGTFALGVIMTVLVGRRRSSATTALVRAFTCTGALGAWTTVSTFAGETDALVRAGKPSLAAGYLMATFASGIAGTTVGMILARAGNA